MMKIFSISIILLVSQLIVGCSVKWYKFDNLEPDSRKLITCNVTAPRSNFIEAYFGLKINSNTYVPSGTYKHLKTIIIFNETKDTLYSRDDMPDILGLSWKQERHLMWRVKTIQATFKYSVDSSGVKVNKEAKFNLKKITNRSRGFMLH